jgi:hypothetical protein
VVVAMWAGLKNGPSKGTDPPETVSSREAGTARSLDRVRLAVLVTFAISGFVSVGAEVVWFRVAVLIIRPTVYAFAVMLATILGGIAIGSYFISPYLSRRAPGLRALAILEFLIAIAIVLSVAALQLGPDLARRAQPVLSRIMPAYLPYLVVHSMLMLFPSALLMGIAFPIGARLWARAGGEGSGAGDVGRFYAANVCGGIRVAPVARKPGRATRPRRSHGGGSNVASMVGRFGKSQSADPCGPGTFCRGLRLHARSVRRLSRTAVSGAAGHLARRRRAVDGQRA